MTGKQSKEERSCAIRSDVKITLDGKSAKLEDLKEGFPAKVTFPTDANNTNFSTITSNTTNPPRNSATTVNVCPNLSVSSVTQNEGNAGTTRVRIFTARANKAR